MGLTNSSCGLFLLTHNNTKNIIILKTNIKIKIF